MVQPGCAGMKTQNYKPRYLLVNLMAQPNRHNCPGNCLRKILVRTKAKRQKVFLPVNQTQQGEAQIWRREVSSRYGQYPKTQAAQPDQLMSDYFFRVSLAMQNKTLLFSLDDTLVNNALQTLNKTRPAMVDVIPTDGIVPLYINPQGVAKLLRNETLTSLPKNLEPVFITPHKLY